MYDYDVVIVGAGPAGSYCAYRLAKSGKKVLLIDKDTFPRDKPCGGAIPPIARSLLGDWVDDIPHVVSKRRYINLDNKLLLDIKNDMLLMRRFDLDMYLQYRARTAGADFIHGRVNDVSVDKDKVCVLLEDGRTIFGKVLVGADGVNSIVRKKLGYDKYRKKPDRLITMVAEVPMDTSNDADHAMHFNFHRGYIGYDWLFPGNGFVNVGTGTLTGGNGKLVQRRLSATLGIVGAGWECDPVPHMVPARPLDKMTGDRFVLIGDAAGFVDPLSGAGIGFAMLSGEKAAHICCHAINVDDFTDNTMKQFETTLMASKIAILKKRHQTLMVMIHNKDCMTYEEYAEGIRNIFMQSK